MRAAVVPLRSRLGMGKASTDENLDPDFAKLCIQDVGIRRSRLNNSRLQLLKAGPAGTCADYLQDAL